jgi:hypothetical protein
MSTNQIPKGLNNDHIDPKHRETSLAAGNSAAWYCPRCHDVWYRQFADETCQGCGEAPNPVLWDGRNTVSPLARSTEAPIRDIVGTSESQYPAEMLLSCDHIVRLTQEMHVQYQRKEFDQIGCVMCWRISRASKEDAKRLGGEITVI